MQEFKHLILGDLSVWYYLAALVFSFLAILLSMWVGSAKRNVESSSTPKKYSWRFLLWDNTKRIVIGLIAIFLMFRFTSSIIGRALSMEVAVAIGFFISLGLDQLIGYIKQKFDFLQMDRTKIMDALK
jgi:hypothetical protein